MIMHGDKQIKQIFHGDKEIIRAYQGDSLVFRSKLIEGEDYERFGWLQTAGGYLDLNYKPIPAYTKIETRYKYVSSLVAKNSLITTDNLQLCGVRDGTNSGSPYSTVIWAFTNVNKVRKLRCDILQDTSVSLSVGPTITTSGTYTISADAQIGKVTINGTTYSSTSYSKKSKERFNLNFHLFGTYMATSNNNPQNYQSSNYKGGLEISYFKLWERDKLIFDLIPAKLIRNVSKDLDGNGRIRNVNEVGLINLIDGTFFGNVDTKYNLLVRN